MFRLAGATVLLGVVLAALAASASAATVPPDVSLYQAQVEESTAREPLDAAVYSWAQRQPAGTASMSDAHQRATPPTTGTAMRDAHERATPPTTVTAMSDAHERIDQPVVIVTETGTELGWTRIVVGGLTGAAFVMGLAVLTIWMFGTQHRRPPLVHH